MGDVAGIGAEIIIKSLGNPDLYDCCRPLVIGDARRLREAGRIVNSKLEVNAINNPSEAKFRFGIADCVDLNLIPEGLRWGQLSAICGDAAYLFIVRAVELAKTGQIDAICSVPLNKEALHTGSPRRTQGSPRRSCSMSGFARCDSNPRSAPSARVPSTA